MARQNPCKSQKPEETDFLKFVELGFGKDYIKTKLGVPISQENIAGFLIQHYSFKDFDTSILYDRMGKVMQYGIQLKNNEFHPEIKDVSEVLNRPYFLGRDSFQETSDFFSPMLLSAYSADSEPFEYYELLNETPQTNNAIRLKFVIPRTELSGSNIKNPDDIDYLAEALGSGSCPGLTLENPSSQKRALSIRGKRWRSQVRPNGVSVQRRLEDAEEAILNKQEIAPIKLCEKDERGE